MPEPREHDADDMPDDDELQQPSTENEPGEEPKKADADEPEPDHEAVGIGIVDRPLTDDDSSADHETPPHPTAAETARADSGPPTDALTDDVRTDAAGTADDG